MISASGLSNNEIKAQLKFLHDAASVLQTYADESFKKYQMFLALRDARLAQATELALDYGRVSREGI